MPILIVFGTVIVLGVLTGTHYLAYRAGLDINTQMTKEEVGGAIAKEKDSMREEILKELEDEKNSSEGQNTEQEKRED